MIIGTTESLSSRGINHNVIMAVLLGTLYGSVAVATQKFIANQGLDKANEADKLRITKFKNMVTNVTLVGTILSIYYFGNPRRIKPAAVVAGIPIGTVQELSHALSDRQLKYRATGGVFLAHQGGGNESLRIICKAFGKSRFVFLTLIDFLFLYGSSRIVDLFANVAGNFSRITEKGFQTSLTQNPWTQFRQEALDEGREEYHLTFPIVTRNRIYTSMYIETYDIVETVENGMKTLTITLFFRKWIPPSPLEFVKRTDLEEGQNLWYRKSNESFAKSYSFLDSVLDFGLTAVMQLYRYVQELSYSAYTPEQYVAISFATGLDKSMAEQAQEGKTLEELVLELDSETDEHKRIKSELLAM